MYSKLLVDSFIEVTGVTIFDSEKTNFDLDTDDLRKIAILKNFI